MNISPANKIPLALSGNKKELEEYLAISHQFGKTI